MKYQRLATRTLAAALLTLPALALAHESNSWVLRAGAVLVEPDEDSSEVRVKPADIGAVAGAEVGVDSNTQLGLTATYKFTDHFGLGILGATPFEHDISGAGPTLGGIGKLGSTRHLPPTISLEFFPLNPSYPIQPYLGIGINYTTFFHEKTSDRLSDVFQLVADANLGAGAVTVRDVDMKLDDSFGLAAELGIDIMLSERLLLNAAIWHVDIDTKATLTGKTVEGVDIDAKVDVDIDPMVYMISLGYRF